MLTPRSTMRCPGQTLQNPSKAKPILVPISEVIYGYHYPPRQVTGKPLPHLKFFGKPNTVRQPSPGAITEGKMKGNFMKYGAV